MLYSLHDFRSALFITRFFYWGLVGPGPKALFAGSRPPTGALPFGGFRGVRPLLRHAQQRQLLSAAPGAAPAGGAGLAKEARGSDDGADRGARRRDVAANRGSDRAVLDRLVD